MSFESRVVLLKKEADLFDLFLSRFSKTSFVFQYAFSIRNSYTAYQELPQTQEGWLHIFKQIAATVYCLLRLPVRSAYLTVKEERVFLRMHPKLDDSVTGYLRIPATEVRFRRKLSVDVFKGFRFIFQALIVSFYLLTAQQLRRKFVFRSLRYMFDYITIFNTIDLSGIKIIVAHRDRYPEDMGIIKKAKTLGIKTVRVDYLSPLDEYCHHTITSEYYFYPNDLTRMVFKKYPGNHEVKYVRGGVPCWDDFSKYKPRPDSDPKIILFMGQVDSDVYTGRDYSYYVNEIYSVLPPGFALYLKPHPLEDAEMRKKQFQGKDIRVVKHGEIETFELIARSTFCFSIHSALSFEAKHVCENSFMINYYPNEAPHADYKGFVGIIDLVKSREGLVNVLNGKVKAVAQDQFIANFNPYFPETRKRLKEVLDTL